MDGVTAAADDPLSFRAGSGIFLVYVALAVLASYPLVLHLTDHAVGFSQEGRTPSATPPLNIWAMATVVRQLPHPLQLFEGTAFYPYHHTLAFSEHLFVPALMGAPVYLATGNWVLAYNVVMFLTLATAGLGMFLLARHLTGDDIASFGAGLLYAFHTWNINELVRSQITANQWFPFVVLALLKFFERPGWRRGLLAGLFYALQSLSCMYWALYLPFLVGGTALYLWWRRRHSWRALFPLAVGLAAAVGLTALFAIPYVLTAHDLGFERPEPFSVPIDRYFDVLPQNLLYAAVLGTALRNQNAAHFLGFAALALAIAGLLGRRRATERGALAWPVLVALVVFGFLLSLGPDIMIGDRVFAPGPYAVLRRFVPGFRNVRYPERLSILLVLGFAPLAALGLARLRARLGARGAAVAALVCGFLFLEHLSLPQTLSYLPAGGHVPQVYRWLSAQSGVTAVAEVPSSRIWMERADAVPMYYGTIHGKRTVQGYTSYFAPTYNFIKWRLFHFPAPASVAFLERFGVDTVVVSAEGGAPPAWARDDPRWTLTGPFPDGHLALRLENARGLAVPPPPDDAAQYAEIDRAGWLVQGSDPGPVRAIDGDLRTAWGTANEQGAGNFYRIRLKQPARVARIAMSLRSPFCFPMHFKLLGEVAPETWIEIPYDQPAAFDRLFSSLLHQPKDATFVVDVEPQELRALRIRITETDPFFMPWMMSEIRLYERRANVVEQDAAPR